MYPKFLLAIALLFSFSLLAQTGIGTGTVTGKITGESQQAVAFANVSLAGSARGAETDAAGRYTIKNVPAGRQTLLYSYLGMETASQEVLVRAGETVTAPPLVLRSRGQDLSEVLVRESRDRYATNAVSPSLRQATEIAKLPQNIQVVSGDLLRDQQVTSIMDGVTRNVSGVTTLEHWGNFARINMRGFRLPAFRNGFNVSDSWGPLAEDMSLVDRIEFVKGPAGFMLAAGEPGGFYNLVTKKPTAEATGEVTLTGGSFDFYRAALDLGGKATEDGKLLYRTNLMYQTADTHRGGEDARRFALAPALTYRASPRTTLTAEVNYQQAESYLGAAYVFAPVSVGYGGLDRNFKTTDDDFPVTDITEVMAFANLDHRFSDKWSATARAGYLRYDQTGASAWNGGVEDNGDVLRRVSIWDALSLGHYAQAFTNGRLQTGKISHTLLAGLDYTDKEYFADFFSGATSEEAFNVFGPVYGTFTAPEFDRSADLRDRRPDPWNASESSALYVQDEIGLWEDRVRLTLAGRFTVLRTFGKATTDRQFTPRVGLSVDVTPTLAAYGLYDQSFLPAAGVSAAGDSFDPVNAIDVEGGLKKSLFDGRVRASLGAFVITKKNVPVGDPDNPMFSVQLGEVRSRGVEFDLQGRVARGLNLVFNYANTDVEITEDSDPARIGTKVAGHSRHVTNAWLTYDFGEATRLDGFGASLGGRYLADRSTWAWGAENETVLPDYFRLDGALFWSKERFRVQLSVNNLLDDHLFSGANFGSYLYWQSEPGVNARLVVTYRFR